MTRLTQLCLRARSLLPGLAVALPLGLCLHLWLAGPRTDGAAPVTPYESGIVQLHEFAEYRREGHEHFLTTVGRIIYNDRVERALWDVLEDTYDPSTYPFVNQPLRKRDMNNVIEGLVDPPAVPSADTHRSELRPGARGSRSAGLLRLGSRSRESS